MDYLHYRLCLFASGRCVYTLAALAPVLVFISLHHEHLVAPASATNLAAFGVSVVLAALLQFLLSCLVAMLAFWVLEISTFVFILLAFERLASGQMFPLDLLPPWAERTLMFTPFPYQMFFPVNVYTGRVTGLALVAGLLTQAAWVIGCYLLARTVWARGVRSYAAVGG